MHQISCDTSKICSKTKTVRIQVRVLLFSGISCNTMNLFSNCLFQFEVYLVVSFPHESVAVPLPVWVYPINSTVCHTVWWLRPACFLHSVNWWIFSFCQQGTSQILELSHPAITWISLGLQKSQRIKSQMSIWLLMKSSLRMSRCLLLRDQPKNKGILVGH